MRTLAHISLLLLLLLCACGGSDTLRRLDAAEALMNERPDSALALLATVDTAGLQGELRARHALYTVCAYNKTGVIVDATFDSLLQISSSYYDSHRGNRADQMLNHYYCGLLKLSDNLYENAIIELLKAEETALSLNHNLQLGLIYRNMSEAFLGLYNQNSAVHYSELALEKFEKARAQKYIPYAICDLAVCYNNAAMYDKAITTAEKGVLSALEIGDSALLANVISTEAVAYMARDEYDKVRNLLVYLRDSGIGYSEICDVRNLGLAYLYTDSIEKAKACAEYLEQVGLDDAFLKYQIFKRQNNINGALSSLQIFSHYQDSIFYDVTHQDAEIQITDFFKERNKLERDLIAQKSLNTMLLLAACVLVIFLMIATIIAQRQSFLKRRANLLVEIETLKTGIAATIDEANDSEKNLEKRLTDARLNYENARQSIRKIFVSQYAIINDLSRAYYEFQGSASEIKSVYKKVISKIDSLRSGGETLANLEHTIDDYFGSLICELRTECPQLSEEDVNLYVYVVAGISPQAIAVLIKRPVHNVYLRKTRLLGKIKKYAPDRYSYFKQYFVKL